MDAPIPEQQSVPPPAAPAGQGARPPAWLRAGLPLLVAAVTFVAFLPALGNDFVHWDDDKLLLDNYGYRGLGPVQIRWMFTTAKMGHYQPLAWLTLGADYVLWGMNPFGYHLTSNVLHAVGAVLVYALALTLLRIACGQAGVPQIRLHLAAAVAALVYAVHPLRVESVAWITERRDVVCMLFLAPAVLQYVRYATGGGWNTYAGAVSLYALSLLAKPWGMTLPVVLLVMDAYPLGRIRWARDELFSKKGLIVLFDKLPFAFGAAIAAMLSLNAQIFADEENPLEQHGWSRRVAQSFYGLCFYLYKTVLPFGLSPLYEIPLKMNPLAPRYIASAIAVVMITVLLFLVRKRWPAGLAAWLIYAISAAPVLGLAQTGPQLVADRYSFVPCVPWAILGGAGFLLVRGAAARRAASGLAVGTVLALSVLSWRQCGFWRDSISLWTRCLAVEPDSWNAHNNLGVQYFLRGDYAAAEWHFTRSVAIKPDMQMGLVNLASALEQMGRRQEAIRHLKEAAKIRTKSFESRLSLARRFASLGHSGAACEIYRELARIDPENTDVQYGLGSVLEQDGQLSAAIEQFQKTLGVIEEIRRREGPRGPRDEGLSQQFAAVCVKLVELFERRGDRKAAREYFEKMQGG